MTSEYAAHRPQECGILPDVPQYVSKWIHSVVHADDFCSEWQAGHRASELALQCGHSTFADPASSSLYPIARSNRRHEGIASVVFNPVIDVLIGEEDSISMVQISVHSDALYMNAKHLV